MSREIKFRAWNESAQKMIDLYKITPFALDSLLKQDGLFLPFSENYILQQFTGKKDKNDKEICEGDILKSYNNRKWEVKFGEYLSENNGGGNGFYLSEINSLAGKFIAPFANPKTPDEIIGNIYENPELIRSTIK